jgi:hypothetical protein
MPTEDELFHFVKAASHELSKSYYQKKFLRGELLCFERNVFKNFTQIFK